MHTTAEANQAVREMVRADLLPSLGKTWRSRWSKGSAECVNVASDVHLEVIRVGTRRRGKRFSVGVGIAVRYPLQHWLVTLGGAIAIGSTSIGYHIGLRHHAPGEDEWWMDVPDWQQGIVSDVAEHAGQFFCAMRTPQLIIDLLHATAPRERLFALGGPEEEVRTIATMYYAYIDQEKGIETLVEWLVVRESQIVRRTLEFLRRRPTLPEFDVARLD